MSRHPTPISRTLEHIPCLDGIRAMAALMVMSFHFIRPTLFPAWLAKAGLIGQTGVDLFFVLSGFLITRILIVSSHAPTGLPEKMKIFYMRRTLRIFPLYFAYLAFHFFVLPRLFGTVVSPWSQQVWAWTYCQTIPATFPQAGASSGPGHFWSLSIEEHFYLVWPLLVLVCSPLNVRRVCLGILLSAPILRYLIFHQGYEVYYFTLTRMDALAFGAWVALLTTHGVPVFFKNGCRISLVILPVVLFGLFFRFSGAENAVVQAVKLSAIPLFYAAAIGWCVFDPSKAAGCVRSVLSLSPLRKTGLIAYGLYVFHPLAIYLADAYAATHGLLWHTLAALILVFAMAIPSYVLLESPMLRLKKFFEHRPPKTEACHA